MGDVGKYLDRMMLGAGLKAEALPGLPLVEMVGKRRVLIENHNGVNCYTENEIHVNSRLGDIRIVGEKMSLVHMTKDCLVITGYINGVSFC